MDLLRKFICFIAIGCCYTATIFAFNNANTTNSATVRASTSAQINTSKKTLKSQHLTKIKPSQVKHVSTNSKVHHPVKTKHEAKKVPPFLPMPPAMILDASSSTINTPGHRITALISNTLTNLRSTTYHLGGTYFNALKGIYRLDCSSYVDHLLIQGAPSAYRSIVAWSGQRPVSWDYYKFFKTIPVGQVWNNWSAVREVAQLRAGDIIALRQELKHRRAVGHMMVVVAEPTKDIYNSDIYYVRVTDSAHSGHTEDTRQGRSGIGAGTMLMKVDPSTQTPYAYAWKVGSPWKNIGIAMARPED